MRLLLSVGRGAGAGYKGAVERAQSGGAVPSGWKASRRKRSGCRIGFLGVSGEVKMNIAGAGAYSIRSIGLGGDVRLGGRGGPGKILRGVPLRFDADGKFNG